MFGNYTFNLGLNLGRRPRPSVRQAADGAGGEPELRERRRDSGDAARRGIQTIDGFKTRTPFNYDTDLHADYAFRFGGTRRVVLLADMFNLFNLQRTTGYDRTRSPRSAR